MDATTPIALPSQVSPLPADGPGKSAQSVGHQAKAAVAEAAANGIELPKNAQGLAASQIARGVEAAMVFQPPAEPAPVTSGEEVTPPVGDAATTPDATTPTGTSAADTALALITAAAESYAQAGDAIATG